MGMCSSAERKAANGYRWQSYMCAMAAVIATSVSMAVGIKLANAEPSWWILLWLIATVVAAALIGIVSSGPYEMRSRLNVRFYVFGYVGPIERLVARIGAKGGTVVYGSCAFTSLIFIAQLTPAGIALGAGILLSILAFLPLCFIDN